MHVNQLYTRAKLLGSGWLRIKFELGIANEDSIEATVCRLGYFEEC